MSSFFVQRPGASCPWRSLQDMLRERHDGVRAHRAASIAQREKDGTPLDDRADWAGEVQALVSGINIGIKRTDAIRLLANAIGIASGGLQPIPEYEPDPEINGVELRIRALSKADVMDMNAEMSAVEYDGEDQVHVWRSRAAKHGVMRPFIAKALTGIRGLTLDDGEVSIDGLTADHPEMGELLDAIDKSGLLASLYVVCRDFQDLSPLARSRYGLSPLSTSEPSSAASAQPSAGRSSDATVAPSGTTSAVTPSERQTGAPGATSSTTHSLHTLSTSTASPTASQEQPASS